MLRHYDPKIPDQLQDVIPLNSRRRLPSGGGAGSEEEVQADIQELAGRATEDRPRHLQFVCNQLRQISAAWRHDAEGNVAAGCDLRGLGGDDRAASLVYLGPLQEISRQSSTPNNQAHIISEERVLPVLISPKGVTMARRHRSRSAMLGGGIVARFLSSGSLFPHRSDVRDKSAQRFLGHLPLLRGVRRQSQAAAATTAQPRRPPAAVGSRSEIARCRRQPALKREDARREAGDDDVLSGNARCRAVGVIFSCLHKTGSSVSGVRLARS